MSIEGGSIGGISGMGAGPAIAAGIETGGLTGAVPALAGPGILGEFRGFGGSGPVNEGPVGLADLKATVPWQADIPRPLGEIRFEQPVVRPLSEDAVLAEAEAIIAQAQKPPIYSPFIPDSFSVIPNEVRNLPSSEDPSLIVQDDKRVESVIAPQVEPVVGPFPMSDITEFPQPQAAVSPEVEPLVQPGLQIENQVFNEAKPIVLTQPALEEQEIQQEMVMERVTAKQIDIDKEEKEEVRLKNVVDKKILETRIGEFGSAADRVGAKAKENSLEEKEKAERERAANRSIDRGK